MNFKDFLLIMEYLDAGSAVGIPSDWGSGENSMGAPVFLPKLDLELPTTTKTGRISLLIKDKNPILLQLDDGTQLYFTLDQFRRISGTPALGRTISVAFQRMLSDRSKMPSIISSCQVT